MGVFFVSCSSVSIFHVQTTGWHPMRSHWFLCNFYKRRLDGNDLDVNRWEIHLSSDVRAAAADEGRGRNWQPQRHGNDVRRRSIWTVQCWCNLRIRWCERVCNAITGIDFFNGREHRFFSASRNNNNPQTRSRMLVNAPQWTNFARQLYGFSLVAGCESFSNVSSSSPKGIAPFPSRFCFDCPRKITENIFMLFRLVH